MSGRSGSDPFSEPTFFRALFPSPVEKFRAVRLTHFGAAVVFAFDRPRRVKLAPPWANTYQTRSVCRNLLIDLLETDARTISYQIEAVGK